MNSMIGETLLNRYRLDAVLGEGGMGVLYRAHDLLLERDVAIKMLKDRGLGSQGKARLMHEAQAAASLDHPNIVSIFDVGEAQGLPYIVMQLVEGDSLYSHHPGGIEETIAISRQICAALEHAHSHGIVHRDLKPENVLITPDGQVKLSDFGLARTPASRLSGEGGLVGTVFYMAPEQALGEAVDGRTDLYALGVLLYELSAGRLPFTADDPVSVISQHLYAPVVPPSTYNQHIPPTLDSLILRLLSKRPADRPPSAAQTADLLAGVTLAAPESAAEVASALSWPILERIVRGRLVGRQPEVAQLHELWAYTLQGNGHLTLISGEPGVGKTRLAHELIVYAQLNQAAVLRAACSEYETATPYLPFSEALREWAAGQSSETLRQRLGSSAFDLARLAPEIENRLGPLPHSPALPANEERLRLFDNVARFFQNLSREHGLLVFIDDIHWADKGTIALLHYLLRRLRSERFMILCAYREIELERSLPLADALVEWNRERMATRIAIARLSPEACSAMLAALFGLERISSEFNELIYHETEGNPFFIEEVVKALIEGGQIYREGDTWQRMEIAELAVPQSVKEAIGRRLNRLSKTCLDALHLAAVLGKTFAFTELAVVFDHGEEALLDALDEAQAAQLIRAQSPDTFSFTHDKIREVLYAELLAIRRRRLHQRIGEGLRDLYRMDLDPHTGELAYHFIESGDLEKGLEYSQRAAQRAESIFAHDEALLDYHRALECAEALNLPGAQAHIYEAIGDIYNRIGPFERAIDAYQRVLDLTGDPAKRLELSAKIGATYANIGDERGVAYLKVAIEGLDPHTQVEARARALAMLGRFHHYRGQGEQAIAYLEEARQLCEPLANPDLLTDIYTYLTGAYQWTGDLEQSNFWAQRTLDLGEQMNFLHAAALGNEFLAENAFIVGNWQESLQYAARDREIGEKIGSQDRVAWSEMSTAFAQHAQGELRQALNTANRGITMAQTIGNLRLELILRAWRARIGCDLGDFEQMRSDLDFIITQAERTGQFQNVTWAYNSLCYTLVVRQEWQELLESADKFEELTGRPVPGWHALAYLGLGMPAEARQAAGNLLAEPEEKLSQVDQAFRWRFLGQYRELIAETEAAAQAYTLSIQKFSQQGARLEHARVLIFRAGLRLSMGDLPAAREDLETALPIFSACEAQADLIQAQQMLAALQ